MVGPGELRRRLGTADAVWIGAGSMIGAGVFVAWAPAARAAGPWLLVGLALAGLVALANATSSAQLAAVHPESGGTYVYARARLGPAWGHLAGWGFVTGKTASSTAMALTIGTYLWPEQQRPVAVLAVVGVAGINLGGLSRTVAVTRVLLAVSLATLALVVVVAWASVDGTGPAGSLDPADRADPVGLSAPGVLRSAGFLFFAFAGYARIATLGEEVRDPASTIPRAIPLALGAVLTVYTVVGVSALWAVGHDGLAGGDAPLEAVLEAADSPLAPVVGVGAGIAAAGVLLNLLPGISRTTLAMARRRELPPALARVDTDRSLPVRAEVTVTAVVAALVAVTGLESAIALSGVSVLTYYALTNAAALTLPPGERRWPRWVAAGGLIGCVVLALSLPPSAVIIGAAVLAAGAAARAVTSGGLRARADPGRSGGTVPTPATHRPGRGTGSRPRGPARRDTDRPGGGRGRTVTGRRSPTRPAVAPKA
jgi:APA family basic amino acid/polyamine antiporter